MATERKRRRLTPQNAAAWSGVLPQYLGIFGLLAQLVIFLVFKIATGETVVVPAFLTAFGGLIVVGQGAEAIAALRAPPPKEDDEAT